MNPIIHQNQVLKLERLLKNFKQGSNTINVFDDVDFTFNSKQTYAITGISGIGKSTILHLIAGFERPSNGTIYYNNKDINKFTNDEKQNYLHNVLGLIFQRPYLLSELTVLENVMLKGLIGGMSYANCLPFAMQLLEKIDLTTKADALPIYLSGGQQQRVALARAIFTKPKFLLADEPTAHLDEFSKEVIIDFLLECQKVWNMGLIIATHDPAVYCLMDINIQIIKHKFIVK